VFADEAKQIEIFLGRLLGKFVEHFGLGFGAENQADLFVPRGVDVIQLASAGMDKLFEHAAFLLHAGDRETGAFERIQDPEQVLALSKDDLRRTRNAAVLFFLVLD
jgi:hypothetical protein